MARYRGKREESQVGHLREEKKASQNIGDPFQDDPFAGDNWKAAKPKKNFKSWWSAYWDSGKGKILVTVLSCLAVFAIVVAVVAKMWIKPPTLPVDPIQNNTPSQQINNSANPNNQTDPLVDTEPEGPTDDELYPDDGYNGDMPTVSGNRKDGIYTFLLVGTDMWDGNTDTIMVVSYDTKEQDINIMSIPRDTMINEKWDLKKINSVYSRTGGSIDSLANRVQKLIGFKPDFYVKVDLSMFVKLVDLVGGVEFDVPQDMNYDDPYQDLHIHLKKGLQTLDGEHAMELVRFRRYSEGDIKRVEVQQEFMKALIKECLSIKHWGKVKAYIDLAMENVQTDLEVGSIVWFASNVLGFNGTPALSMDDVYTCTIPGDYWGEAYSRSTGGNQSYVTIYPRQVVELVNERFNPYEQRVTTSMLDAMSILSNGDIASSTGVVKDSQHNVLMAVQRGEAYYDENGQVVYGKPPATPKQDENGNYYILDENGQTVFTDENGKPLTGGPGTSETDINGQPVTLPLHPTDGNQTNPGNSSSNPNGQTASGNNQTTPGNNQAASGDNQTYPDNQTMPSDERTPTGGQGDPAGQTEPDTQTTDPDQVTPPVESEPEPSADPGPSGGEPVLPEE